MGGPVLQGSPTRRTRLHRLPDGLLGRPTPAPDDGPVASAHPAKRAPPNAVHAAPRLPGRRPASALCARSRPPSAKSRRPFGQLDFAVIVLYITYPETLNKYVRKMESSERGADASGEDA
jgi:hypothetical protein